MARQRFGNKKERAERIARQAREMARSGEYSGWYAIEVALRAMGLTEARQQLDDQFVRSELDRMCKEAKAAKGGG